MPQIFFCLKKRETLAKEMELKARSHRTLILPFPLKKILLDISVQTIIS